MEFPSRFLKKLEIYQQIRKGEGISRYKHLWKYEAAFLQYSYGGGHQHLSNFVSRSNFKKWIEYVTPFDPKTDEKKLNNVIANLFWRGYIDVVERINYKKTNIPFSQLKLGQKLLNRKEMAYVSNLFGGESNFDYRANQEGLLVGEVLNEINNKNPLSQIINKYKYNWVLDSIWLLVFYGLFKFIFPENIFRDIEKIHFGFSGLNLNYPILALIFIFLVWPLISFIIRRVLISIEK
ncbi:hypothetical protein HY345_01970 [Candidatus Microgenomates bacterium]|nr:hypothetical protein [Candidatus Microgenomates bacterium]